MNPRVDMLLLNSLLQVRREHHINAFGRHETQRRDVALLRLTLTAPAKFFPLSCALPGRDAPAAPLPTYRRARSAVSACRLRLSPAHRWSAAPVPRAWQCNSPGWAA